MEGGRGDKACSLYVELLREDKAFCAADFESKRASTVAEPMCRVSGEGGGGGEGGRGVRLDVKPSRPPPTDVMQVCLEITATQAGGQITHLEHHPPHSYT